MRTLMIAMVIAAVVAYIALEYARQRPTLGAEWAIVEFIVIAWLFVSAITVLVVRGIAGLFGNDSLRLRPPAKHQSLTAVKSKLKEDQDPDL
jgi:hypothetical protein